MRKKIDNSYADAMSDWAAKQSLFRNRNNRFIHPDPSLPGLVRFFGYLFRVSVVLFIFWIIGLKLVGRYFNGQGFNDKVHAAIASSLNADEIDAERVAWIGKKALCKRITATGNDVAFYRNLTATGVTFALPLHKRFSSAWTVDRLHLETLDIELRSGGKSHAAASAAQKIQSARAGLRPEADLDQFTFARLTCGRASLRWGLGRSTFGALEGATNLTLFNHNPGWRIELRDGLMRQNWIRDLHIKSLSVHKIDDRIVLSDSEVSLGGSSELGTLDGHVTLERIPHVQLKLTLPEARSRDLFPSDPSFPDYFFGDLKLVIDLEGSTNTMAGIETSGSATFIRGTFNKIPAFDAVDQLLRVNNFRVYSPDRGKLAFRTHDGQFEVSDLECTSADASSMLRGQFVYTPPITLKQANAANTISAGNSRISPRPDNISGNLQLGVRQSLIAENELAKQYFSDTSDGYVWIDIPLDGPLKQATKIQQAEILETVLGANQ